MREGVVRERVSEGRDSEGKGLVREGVREGKG